MWSMVAQRLTLIAPPATTPDNLWKRVEAAWCAVPQEPIQSLFEPMPRRSFRSYYPYGLNVIWKGESVLLAFKQKSEDSLYIPNFDKSIDNSNNIRSARISRAKRRKRVTRDMLTLKNSMLELAVKFDDNYNTGLIKSFMFGMCVNKTEIKIMTDILSRYKFRDSHETKVPVHLINTTTQLRQAQGHETTQLRVQGDIKDVSGELGNGG
ncbi:uncharacterized protein TNCV_983261 [Trichonephila clavipes]|nr:uncharacterized protein TNCV_983261 [Trichonephila clavipes]